MNMPANLSHLSSDFPSSAARRAPLQFAPPTPARNSSHDTSRKFVAKGHDSQLQEAQNNKFPVTLTLMSQLIVSGIILKRDKYTITVRYTAGLNSGMDEIYYKHAIESVLIDRRAPAATAE